MFLLNSNISSVRPELVLKTLVYWILYRGTNLRYHLIYIISRTCKYFIFSLAIDTNGSIMMALRRVSNTFLSINSSATSILPAEVGAEYTKLRSFFYQQMHKCLIWTMTYGIFVFISTIFPT